MRKPLGVKSKLILWYLLVTSVLIVFFHLVAYFLLSQGLHGITVYPWEIHAADVVKTADGDYVVTGFSDSGQQYQAGSIVKISKYSQSELAALPSEDGSILVNNILIDKAAFDAIDLSEGDSVWFYSSFEGDKADLLVVTKSTDEAAAILTTFRQNMLFSLPLAIVIVGIIGYFCVKRALHPVQVITEAAQEIEGNKLGKRLDVLGDDELGRLSETLNHMLVRLEKAFDREKQFTADASHELRTPLAVVQAETTLALKKERNVEEYQKSLEMISLETERMSLILKKLLFLARNESAHQPEFKKMNLKEFLTRLEPDIKLLCEDKPLHFRLEAQEDLIIKGDEMALEGLILNLIDNAVRYTPQGGEISILLKRQDNHAGIAVKDTGIGISEEHLQDIFERFYRVDKSRSRSEGGAGLGLSICRRIAEIHNGTIDVESKPREGSTFSVLIPLISGE